MVVPGSMLAALSITYLLYTMRLFLSPPLPSLSATYDNSVIVCHRFIPVPPSSTATPPHSRRNSCRCSTLSLIACHCPWLIKSGFVSVGDTPQMTDICVCCRHVHNVRRTRRRHSLKSAFFLPTRLCREIVSPTHFPTWS